MEDAQSQHAVRAGQGDEGGDKPRVAQRSNSARTCFLAIRGAARGPARTSSALYRRLITLACNAATRISAGALFSARGALALYKMCSTICEARSTPTGGALSAAAHQYSCVSNSAGALSRCRTQLPPVSTAWVLPYQREHWSHKLRASMPEACYWCGKANSPHADTTDGVPLPEAPHPARASGSLYPWNLEAPRDSSRSAAPKRTARVGEAVLPLVAGTMKARAPERLVRARPHADTGHAQRDGGRVL